MRWPIRVQDNLNTHSAQHPTWVADDSGPSPTPRFRLNEMFAQSVAFELGQRYGLKRADPGRPISSEVLAWRSGGHLYAWAWENKHDGTVEQFPLAEDITGQVFVPVEPMNHLGVDVPSTQDPPLLQSQWQALYSRLGRLETMLRRLEAKPAPVYEGSAAIRVLGTAPITLRPK